MTTAIRAITTRSKRWSRSKTRINSIAKIRSRSFCVSNAHSPQRAVRWIWNQRRTKWSIALDTWCTLQMILKLWSPTAICSIAWLRLDNQFRILRTSKRRYHIRRSLPSIVWIWNLLMPMKSKKSVLLLLKANIFINDDFYFRMLEFLGFESDDLIGKSVYEYHHAMDMNVISTAYKSCKKNNKFFTFLHFISLLI